MEIDRQEAINQTKAAISNDKASELGFQDDYQAVFSTGKGLNEDIIRQISAKKNEPQWMLDYRLQAYQTYLRMPMHTWGPDLSEIHFEDI